MVELGCLMIKPDAHNRGIAITVKKDILSILPEYGLEFICSFERTLSTDEVLMIYPDIHKKSHFKEFMELMTSNSSTVLFVRGLNIIPKLKNIRGEQQTPQSPIPSGLRAKYCYAVGEDSINIEAIIGSVVHSPDTMEEIAILRTVFGTPITSD
jgi:nucleoside diphosphate kinase